MLKGTQEGQGGVVSFICNNIYKLLSYPFDPLSEQSTPSEASEAPALEVSREGQFQAYVNNRMNILVMWVQHMKLREINTAKQHLEFFLYDMEHHFVDPYAGREIRNAFRWLKVYVRIYPEVFRKNRAQRAYEMIASIYDALGFKFPLAEREDHDRLAP